MTSTARPARLAQTRARPWYIRLLYILLLLIGLAGIGVALVQLVRPVLPLQIEQLRLGPTPVTVYSPPDGTGPAVVIAHGFAGSQQIMAPFARTLARNGYVALIFDFPGHGRNTVPFNGDLTDSEGRYAQLSATLDEVVGLARERGDGRVGLLGHSMGSEAVARYAQQNPAIAAVVGVSLVYDEITPDSPPNLLVLTGALEAGLRPLALDIAAQAAAGAPETGVTYGEFTEDTARRVVFPPYVEHIGVLFSPVSLAETVAWFDTAFDRARRDTTYIDDRWLWLGVWYLAAFILFWPFSQLLQFYGPSRAVVVRTSLSKPDRYWWWALALLPVVLTPVLLRLLPVSGGLPILVGGPLALHFAIYGGLTAGGLIVWQIVRQQHKPVAPAGAAPAAPATPAPLGKRLTAWWRQLLMAMAVALLVVGYVFLTFGVPTQFFLLNYFPPPARWSVAAVVFAAMLVYFLADEALTRSMPRPRGAYALTKLLFIISLVLAIALNPNQLFFLVLIAPLFVVYFIVYGIFSGQVYRRTGTIIAGALTNAVIFAWIVAAAFPLVG